MAELLAAVHVGYVHLNHRRANGLDAVGKRDAGVGVSPGVQHNAVVVEAYALNLVDERALVVALKITQFNLWLKAFAQALEIAFKSPVAIDARFSCAQEVEVWSIYDCYLHSVTDCNCPCLGVRGE